MAYWNLFENHSVNANWKDVFFLGNLCVDGAIWDIYGFRNHIYEIWKLAFNVESYVFFMHSEPGAYFRPRLPPRSPSQQHLWVHVSTGWNWTTWKLKNQNLTFPQKHHSGQFFISSLSFDTHFSHVFSLHHLGEVENHVWFSKIYLISVQKPLIPFVSS